MYSDKNDEARQWHELLARVYDAERRRDQIVREILEEHDRAHQGPAMWCKPACRTASSAAASPGTVCVDVGEYVRCCAMTLCCSGCGTYGIGRSLERVILVSIT